MCVCLLFDGPAGGPIFRYAILKLGFGLGVTKKADISDGQPKGAPFSSV